jgi:uncharacterized tellurite resistance protein B-like protein
MNKPQTIEEIVDELDEKLEDVFNQAVKTIVQQIKGNLSEEERDKILATLGKIGISKIREKLQQVDQNARKEEREKTKVLLKEAYMNCTKSILSDITGVGESDKDFRKEEIAELAVEQSLSNPKEL